MNGFIRALISSACKPDAETRVKAAAASLFVSEMLRRAANEQRAIEDDELRMCLRLNTAALTMGMRVPWPMPHLKLV